MERSLDSRRLSSVSSLQPRQILIVSAIGTVLVLGVIWWGVQQGYFLATPASDPGQTDLASTLNAEPKAPSEVRLTAAKLDAAGIVVQEAKLQNLRSTKTVAGMIEYDPARHLELTTPVDCLVLEVLVRPGESIAVGDRVAVLVSEQVGTVRDEIRRLEDDLRVKQRAFTYADEILQNVQALLPQLESSKFDLPAIEKFFTGKRLGEHREHLFVAYSKLATAQQVWNESEALATSGALAGRTVQQRKSELEIARIGAVTQVETSLFESQQARDLALADKDQSQRQLQIEQSRLRSLLGSLKIASNEEPQIGSDSSQMTVLAPQAGHLESDIVVKHQRLKAGDRILTIGDSSHVWLSAAIHERDWPASQLQPGEPLQFRLPALGDRPFTAVVRFVGTQVSAETRALPVVAEIDNKDGLLKPGMFAWVNLPVEARHETLAVPAAAITYHDNQPFVFCEIEPGYYRRQDVKLKGTGEELVEVVEGLASGQRIVVNGAFQLKSELLLEREE